MATDPIRSKQQLKAMADYWLKQGNFRNYILIILGVYTALRVSDLLKLRDEDVYDFKFGAFRSHITVTEEKTGKTRVIALNKKAIYALRLWFPHRRGGFIFANNRKNKSAISRIQAWRIIKETATELRISGRIACHSLRKTFGYFACKAGVSPVMLMGVYNHSSFDITKLYLGITQEEIDEVYTSVMLM